MNEEDLRAVPSAGDTTPESRLATCRDCGHSVSKLAAACPYCGRPLEAEGVREAPATPGSKGPGRASAFWLAFFIPVIGLILGLVRAFDTDPQRKATAGFYLGGALAGGMVGALLGFAIWPMLELSSAGGATYQQGIEEYQAGNMTGAENSFRAAVTSDPGLAVGWVNLAAAQLNRGDAADAEGSARRAVELVDRHEVGGIPDGETEESISGLAHGNLAAALAKELRFREATEEAEKALALYPDSPRAGSLRAIIKFGSEASTSMPVVRGS